MEFIQYTEYMYSVAYWYNVVPPYILHQATITCPQPTSNIGTVHLKRSTLESTIQCFVVVAL